VTVRLAANAEAPRKARQSLRRTCLATPGHILHDAELLTSEIVTNVVKHAGGMITMVVECDARNLAVAVADDSPDEPVLRRSATNDVGGRGMQLVDRLAAVWGCKPRADGKGKIVWFRLAV
jgi:anti-sigma regulatory factor (Ser/Thr protein kinase)